MSRPAWIIYAVVMAIGMVALVFSSCATVGETTTERVKAECDYRGGSWTTFGCVYHTPRASLGIPAFGIIHECTQLGGTLNKWDQCSKSIMEDS